MDDFATAGPTVGADAATVPAADEAAPVEAAPIEAAPVDAAPAPAEPAPTGDSADAVPLHASVPVVAGATASTATAPAPAPTAPSSARSAPAPRPARHVGAARATPGQVALAPGPAAAVAF